jgi:hypothetical protein
LFNCFGPLNPRFDFLEGEIPMTLRVACVVVGFLSLVSLTIAQTSTQPASSLPRLVRFGGTAKDLNGSPMTGIVGITFALYSEKTGGSPLWLETQNATADGTGHYTVLLGSTKPEGLPAELFTSEQARWVGVQVSGQPEQARVLLVSAPYALKAGDAETIGGLPPSAFVLAAPPTANTVGARGGSKEASVTPATSSDVTTTGGRVNTIPLFTTTTNVQNSILTQTGTTVVNVGGNLNLPALGRFEIGSNLFGFGSYASGNALLGFAGNTAMVAKGNTAIGYQALHSDIGDSAGGGAFNTAVGYQALYKNNVTSGTEAQDNTAIGYQALQANTTGYFNTASGYQALSSNTSGLANTATGQWALRINTTGYGNTANGTWAMIGNTTGYDNTATGYEALFGNSSGKENTANGWQALADNTTGSYNTATGFDALLNNTGGRNTAVGWTALLNNATGSNNTAVGYNAGPDMNSTGLTNSTAIGANAVVSESNALILGGTGQYALNVGIGTATPSNVFTIAQGAGHAIADGWDTYSSRRWKTDIHTLHGALGKIGQLRGVSYDRKDSGKHDIGLIAEEVGAVVPEVVTYEENGKDARGVDYSRLTALLIEAIKEQQGEFRQEQAELAKALRQIKQQQTLLRKQTSAVRSMQAEVREARDSLRKVKAQGATFQPALVAAK